MQQHALVMGRRSDHSREELTQLILDAARAILREEGLKALSSRKIAKRIGYTVGTIFQVFGSMDRLMVAVNIDTLKKLHEACQPATSATGTEDRLWVLADAFLEFADKHPAEWDAVISYQYTDDQTQDKNYRTRIEALLELILETTKELYGPDDVERHRSDIRVLWTSMYGIFVLNSAGRLTEGYDARRMVAALIYMFLAARQG